MKYFYKKLLLLCLCVLNSNVYSQDKQNPLINYAPNSNFIVAKIKNAKELKANLENHPLKKVIYSSKTRDLIDEMIQKLKDEFYDESSEGSEDEAESKELNKKIIDKLLASIDGEILLTVSLNNTQNESTEYNDEPSFTLLAQVDQEIFKEYIKAELVLEEKSIIKKIITKKEHENIEYYSIAEEGEEPTSFTAATNGIAVITSDEEIFKKVLTAIVKKRPYEKGLKTNDKMVAFMNANQNKEILFTGDFVPIFKEMLDEMDDEEVSMDDDSEEIEIKEKGPNTEKMMFEAMQLEKLFLINASYEHKDKVDNFEVTLNCLDEGILQYVTLINSEFTPSAFISSDISAYSRIFFSISELRKKIMGLITKTSPEVIPEYQEFLKMAKTNFQFDLEAFIDSMGDDIESYNIIHKDGGGEALVVNKLRNQADFITNFGSILNNPMVKLNLGSFFSLVENKENENHFWVLTTKASEMIKKEVSLAAGAIESNGFISVPGALAQKHIVNIKKGAETKLSGLASYNTARAMFPAKIAAFSFATAKDLYASLKIEVMKDKTLEVDVEDKEFEKFIKILEELKAEDFSGNLSMGLWKDKNKLSGSIKLINK